MTSSLLQKLSAKAGYMSSTSSRSARWILCRSQYVRARTSALDLPGRAWRLTGSPKMSFLPASQSGGGLSRVWLQALFCGASLRAPCP